VSLGPTLVAFTGGLYHLSLSPHSSITLSRGLILPSTLTPWPGSIAGLIIHSFGATQPLSPPCSMHKAPGKGGHSQPAINHHALCTLLGLTHHHPSPSGLAVITSFIFNLGITEMDTPTSYPHSPFLGNCPQLLSNPCSSPSLSNTTLSLPPY
jgi:hypothetical protein